MPQPAKPTVEQPAPADPSTVARPTGELSLPAEPLVEKPPAVKPPPTKHDARIAAKGAHLADQIADLKRNTTIVARVGGGDSMSLGDEVAFQEARAAVLTWCAAHTAAEIVARRTQVHAQLGTDGVAAKAGSMRGLPPSVVTLICEAVLLDLALGE